MILGLPFFSQMDLDFYIGSFAKTASKKNGIFIRSTKFFFFFFLKVVLYHSKSAIRPCLKYCCRVWVDGLSYYLDILDKLQDSSCNDSQVCKTHPAMISSLSLLFKLTDLVPLPYSSGRSTRYSNSLFLSQFLDVIRIYMSTVSFLAQLDSVIMCL